MDSEFDQRVDQNIRRIDHMKKYKSRYKSMLVSCFDFVIMEFMKYKVVDMLNRMTDGSIDSLIDVDKVLVCSCNSIVDSSNWYIQVFVKACWQYFE